MSSESSRGIALIINNFDFGDHCFPGNGKDGDTLSQEFRKLKYDVINLKNKTSDEMKTSIKSVKDMVLSKHDSLIVVIASHGNEIDDKQVVYGSDYKYLDLTTEVIDIFNNKQCPQLQNAVKLFIIDCCRGGDQYPGIDATRLCLRNRNLNFNVVGTRDSTNRSSMSNSSIPVYTKTIVVNATQKGFVSKNLPNGSILIWAFVKCLQEFSGTMTLKKLIEEVGRYVELYAKEENFNQKIQIENIADIGDFSLVELKSVKPNYAKVGLALNRDILAYLASVAPAVSMAALQLMKRQ